MSWTSAVSDLRQKLNDNQTDKLRYLKKVIGRLNGSNKIFKTYEFRRWTDFTSAPSPEGIYLDGIIIPTSGVFSDATGSGQFELVSAPSSNSELEAVYYTRWFLDSELEDFLRSANNWLGFGDDYSTLNSGLRPSALDYAASEAYEKMALRWSEDMSDTYLLEDAPKDDEKEAKNSYLELSKFYREEAKKKRDDFYTRQGQPGAPLRGYFTKGIRKIEPNR